MHPSRVPTLDPAHHFARPRLAPAHEPSVDWTAVARLLLTSRALDQLEEEELVPGGKVRYQFSARGHELAQILLALRLDHAHDAASVYYRSRPFMLASGLTPEEAIGASMARGPMSAGRDIGVVFNMASRGRATVLPMTGDVGGQFTPAAGWAQTICYRQRSLGELDWQGAVAVAAGGDGSTATGGFWASLNMAAALSLPMLFFVEDNGFAISVPSTLQTPGGDVFANLRSYNGILLLDGDGADPLEAAARVDQALEHVRGGNGPALLRMRVPRLNGHSSADNQAYKDDATRAAEQRRDPLPRLRAFLLERGLAECSWNELAEQVAADVREATARALAYAPPDTTTTRRFVFAESGQPQCVGGLLADKGRGTEGQNGALGHSSLANGQGMSGPRINMIDAIRRTLEHELAINPRMLVFGEDVGRKGGVHGATRDLQAKFGSERVFDTSLSEEGIIGRAVGMALGGLLPVPEIQFRKYTDPAMEQITDCGTIRWRTNNTFGAPVVIRIPLGFSKRSGDPWHSSSGEAIFAHTLGWRIAFPSNAADAAGLLRAALRGNDPTFFLEHRALLDTADGRSPYPGDDAVVPFGKAAIRQAGELLTVVTWGAMVQRCVEAAAPFAGDVEIVDLRTLVPWDRDCVLESVRKTGRCLVVHEDTWTAGFGSEVAATVAQEAFTDLDAPVARVAAPDCPVPYSLRLMATVVPSVELIRAKIEELLRF